MRFLRKNIFFLIAIAASLSAFYFQKTKIIYLVKQWTEKPCVSPLTYSIGAFDTKFGITKVELLADLAKAENIWEKTYSKELFAYDPESNMPVNLIYDYRQQATDKLHSIGLVIKDDKAGYEALKSKYDSMVTQYARDKATLKNEISLLETKKVEYEKQVDYWNTRGGAPKSEYANLQNMKDEINRSITSLNAKSDSLNNTADTINSLATVINEQISKLNLNVEKYNTTTTVTGEEFDEGEYITEAGQSRIDIYQFDSRARLVRVLAHELGHALGLGHVNDPKSIMYKLNQSENDVPTSDDIVELNKVCGNKI